jgi:hypothetical protein
MNVVMIIPTGINCSIGGQSGDATPAAKLLAAVCDKLILHPNVVNAADINEMPSNALYVDGGMLDRFLAGQCTLQEVKWNRILVVANEITPELENVVNAAYYSAGMMCSVEKLNTPLRMRGWVENGRANGEYSGAVELVEQVKAYSFDALAVHSPIEVEDPETYALEGGVNPYGKIEAMVSNHISTLLHKPVAHAPNPDCQKNVRVASRLGAEGISGSNLFCVLKGLHKAPRESQVSGLHITDIDMLVSPMDCRGAPHAYCEAQDIPILVVRNNTTAMRKPIEGINVENYVEAAGLIAAWDAGVNVGSLK